MTQRVARKEVKEPRWHGRPDARRSALLDAAALEFNTHGISGASLPKIARAVGLTRAALYYYFESREALAVQCYQRACRTTAQDLIAARDQPNGLARLLDYVARTLAPERPPAVVLSEIAFLGEAHRRPIEAAHGNNVDALEQFVRDGIADGSIRDCDPEIVAQAIVGITAFVPLAEEWSAAGATVHSQAAEALRDFLLNGVAVRPDEEFHCPVEISAFAHRPANAFDRRQAASAKVDLLARTASRLFNRRGIDGVSLDSVTRELGATKGAFYQYLRDKSALVIECHRRAQRLYSEIADTAEQLGSTGLARAMTGLHLLTQAAASDLSPLLPLTGVEALPARARDSIRRRGFELQRRYEGFGRQGMADGSYRKVDTGTLATIGAGAFSWIPRWRRDDDPRTPRQVADEMVTLFMHGLRRR